MSTDFSLPTIHDRIQASIQPVLDRADFYLRELQAPEKVGRHHPDYVSRGRQVIDAMHQAMKECRDATDS